MVSDVRPSSVHQPYDARTVTNFIIHYHRQRNEEITQLRLYKLLYFCHGWYLVERGVPLVWNNFEAWQNGPVIKVVRDCFASFKEQPIVGFASMFDLRTDRAVELPHHLLREDELFVAGVVEAYRKYSSEQLSLITHTLNSPWDEVWKSRQPTGRFGLRIRNDEILIDFKNIVDNTDCDYHIGDNSDSIP